VVSLRGERAGRDKVQRGVRAYHDAQLLTRLDYVVGEDVPRPERHLRLDHLDAVHARGAPDGRAAHLGQRDAADLALGHELAQLCDGVLDGDARVDARAAEQVDGLGPREDGVALRDHGAHVLRRAVQLEGAHVDDAALDAQHHLRGVGRVPREVAADQVEGVVVRGAVEVGAVPLGRGEMSARCSPAMGMVVRGEYGVVAAGQGFLEDSEGDVLGGGVGTAGESWRG
jgi:hypothetical protein